MDSFTLNENEISFKPEEDNWQLHGLREGQSSIRGSALRCVGDNPETLANLRRENFRLRLLCYNYENTYKTMRLNPESESSKMFELETENVQLNEDIREKSCLLRAASALISSLKTENESLRIDNQVIQTKLNTIEKEWRTKYDAAVNEVVGMVSEEVREEHRDDVQSESLAKPRLRRSVVTVDLTPSYRHLHDENTNLILNSGEVTQYSHSESSRCFNETDNRNETQHSMNHEPSTDMEADIARLQRELVRVKNNLISQVKTNTRLKAAYNTLSLSVANSDRLVSRHPMIDLSQSLRGDGVDADRKSRQRLSQTFAFGTGTGDPPDKEGLSDVGDAVNMLNETSSHLHAALTNLKLDISNDMVQSPVSSRIIPRLREICEQQISANDNDNTEEQNEADCVPPTEDRSLNKLRDLYSVISNLLTHLDDVRTVQCSFVETINRSLTCNMPIDGNDDELPVGPDACDEQCRHQHTRKQREVSWAMANGLQGDNHHYLRLSSITPDRQETSMHLDDLPFSNETFMELRQGNIDEEEGEEPFSALTITETTSSAILNRTFPVVNNPPVGMGSMPQGRFHLANNNTSFNLTLDLLNRSSGDCMGNTTFVEVNNRKVFERLSEAMTRLGNAIEECSEVAAADLANLFVVKSTATQSQMSRFVVSKQQQRHIDGNPISLCSATMSNNTIRSRDGFPLDIDDDEISEMSEADTLDNISRPQSACTIDSVPGLDTYSLDSQVSNTRDEEGTLSTLLNRFVHVMLRMHTISANLGGTDSSGSTDDNSPQLNTNLGSANRNKANGDTSENGVDGTNENVHAALSGWTQKAKVWFMIFTSSLRRRDQLPVIEEKLEELEQEFLQTFAKVETIQTKAENDADRCMDRLCDVQGCAASLFDMINTNTHDQLNAFLALQAKYDDLSNRFADTMPKMQYEEMRSQCGELAQVQELAIRELEKLVGELKDKLDEVDGELADALLSLKACPVSAVVHQALQEERDLLQTRVEEAEAKGLEFNSRAENLQSELEQSTAELHKLHEKLNATVDEVVQLQTRLSTVESSFSDQTNSLQAVAKASRQFASRLAADSQDRVSAVTGQLPEVSLRLVNKLANCTVSETNVLANLVAIESLLCDFKLADERVDALRIVTKQTELAKLRDVYEARLAEQREELEELLEGRICTYEKTINEIEERYSMIVAVAKTKQMTAEQDVAASAKRELEMSTELKAKQQQIACLNDEIETVRRAANQALVKFEDEMKQYRQAAVTAELQRGTVEGQLQKRPTEEENRIRKYPELKAIAFDLKRKLIQRTESCESKLQEVKRLRNIIKDDETRVHQVLKEIEHLREQVMQKNLVIRKLESLVDRLQSCAVPEDQEFNRNQVHITAIPVPETLPSVEARRASVLEKSTEGVHIAENIVHKASLLNVVEEEYEERNTSPYELIRNTCTSLPLQLAFLSSATAAPMCSLGSVTKTSFTASTNPLEHVYQLRPHSRNSVSSLISNVITISQNLSDCLEMQHFSRGSPECSLYSQDEVSMSVSEGAKLVSLSTSSNCLPVVVDVEDRKSSNLQVSVCVPLKDNVALGNLQENIVRCASQSSSLCSSLMNQLQDIGPDDQISKIDCRSKSHKNARSMIRRIINNLSNTDHSQSGSTESKVTNLLPELKIVLNLLKVRPASAPEKASMTADDTRSASPISSSASLHSRRSCGVVQCKPQHTEPCTGACCLLITNLLTQTDDVLTSARTNLEQTIVRSGHRTSADFSSPK